MWYVMCVYVSVCVFVFVCGRCVMCVCYVVCVCGVCVWCVCVCHRTEASFCCFAAVNGSVTLTDHRTSGASCGVTQVTS